MSLDAVVPGVYLLHGKVKASLDDYWQRYKAGEFPIFDRTAKAAAAGAAGATPDPAMLRPEGSE